MLTLWGSSHRFCDGLNRRDFLRVGGLGVSGLTMADLFRLRAHAGPAAPPAPKSIIMIYLPGGPSHIDMYDLKPNAPEDIRGAFKPIQTTVPGMQFCELMPRQAQIAERFAVVNGVQTVDFHSPDAIMTGFPKEAKRPVFGSVVSRVRGSIGREGIPRYVALGGDNISDTGDPAYLGAAHKPFHGGTLSSLGLVNGVSAARLSDRKSLLRGFDSLSRELGTGADSDLAGVDSFTTRALEMISSPRTRVAFDVSREPDKVRARYGKALSFLVALRLVQAGVSVVTVSASGALFPFVSATWDTHGRKDMRSEHFDDLRMKLPAYDQAVTALLSDLSDRGLAQDVLVVICGEFGRSPRINKLGGRDHWPLAGSVLFAGGGLKMGQMIGDTGPKAERARGRAYTQQNVLATIYRVLCIDPEMTFPNLAGRPMYLLDDREPIAELF